MNRKTTKKCPWLFTREEPETDLKQEESKVDEDRDVTAQEMRADKSTTQTPQGSLYKEIDTKS